MLTVTSSKLIPMDAHRLWDVLTTPAAYPDWATNHVEFVGDVPAQFRAGTDYVQKITSIGSSSPNTWPSSGRSSTRSRSAPKRARTRSRRGDWRTRTLSWCEYAAQVANVIILWNLTCQGGPDRAVPKCVGTGR